MNRESQATGTDAEPAHIGQVEADPMAYREAQGSVSQAVGVRRVPARIT